MSFRVNQIEGKLDVMMANKTQMEEKMHLMMESIRFIVGCGGQASILREGNS